MERSPRPTEYKGIRYRSKSEAMFARFLELTIETEFSRNALSRNNFRGGFVYEPQWLSLGEYIPDFFFWQVYASKHSEPAIYGSAIEYKPARPTATYIDEFGKRCCALSEMAPHYCSYELYWGGFFGGESGLVVWTPGSIPFVESSESGWAERFGEQIRGTRFDLEAA